MATTYTFINKVVVGTGAPVSIDFTSIPSTYTDLYVSFSLRTNLSTGAATYDDMALRVNGDTANNYSRMLLRDRLGSVGSTGVATTSFMDLYSMNGNTATSNTFGNGYFYITNYAGSDYKSLSCDGASEDNSANGNTIGFAAGLWKSTSAITSFSIYSQNGSGFIQNSTAYLYGVSKS
jgi:hypothetical protein